MENTGKGRKRRRSRGSGVAAGRKSITAVLVAVVLFAGGYIGFDDIVELIGYGEAEIADTVASGEMRVTFLDVDQGDCTLIQTEGYNVLMDTGNNDQGEKVVSYLEERGVEQLDYLILTHPDADHIGGGDNVLEAVDVETVLMPDIANDTMTYDEVLEDIEAYHVEIKHPQVGDVFELGDAQFTVLCPEEELVSEDDMNDSSVGIKLVHGKNSFVMCGDAEEKSEQAMVARFGKSLESDVLKCGHHGSSTATSDIFLKVVNPTWAVISCGKGNSYGHPHREVLSKLEDDDILVYRTDELGMITAVSDGADITWKKR